MGGGVFEPGTIELPEPDVEFDEGHCGPRRRLGQMHGDDRIAREVRVGAGDQAGADQGGVGGDVGDRERHVGRPFEGRSNPRHPPFAVLLDGVGGQDLAVGPGIVIGQADRPGSEPVGLFGDADRIGHLTAREPGDHGHEAGRQGGGHGGDGTAPGCRRVGGDLVEELSEWFVAERDVSHAPGYGGLSVMPARRTWSARLISGRAPRCPITSAAATAPSRALAAMSCWRASPRRKPAANTSPAPVVSMTRLAVSAGTATVFDPSLTRAPCSLRVTATTGHERVNAFTAAAASASPVSWRASCSLASRMSTSGRRAMTAARWAANHVGSDNVRATRRSNWRAAATAARMAASA